MHSQVYRWQGVPILSKVPARSFRFQLANHDGSAVRRTLCRHRNPARGLWRSGNRSTWSLALGYSEAPHQWTPQRLACVGSSRTAHASRRPLRTLDPLTERARCVVVLEALEESQDDSLSRAPLFASIVSQPVLRIITELDQHGSVVRSWSEPVDGMAPAPTGNGQVHARGPAGRAGAGPAPVNGHGASLAAQHQQHAPQATAPAPIVEAELSGWARVLSRVLAEHEVCDEFAGMSLSELVSSPGFLVEVRTLQLHGVSAAVELVLRFGVGRCKQVRVWAEKRRKVEHVGNLPGLICKTIMKGPPASRAKK